MDDKQDMEVVNVAIQRLIEDEKAEKKRTRQVAVDGNGDGDLFGDEDDGNVDQLLLSKLLSQVETSKGDGEINQIPPELIPRTKEAISDAISAAENSKSSEETSEMTESTTTEEIMKELKIVRRQNTITHWLLSIMIVLTVTWQLSEVSFIMKVKNGVAHPFRSIGNTVTGMLKRGKQGKDKLEDSLEELSGSIPALKIKIPELHKIDVKGHSDELSTTLE